MRVCVRVCTCVCVYVYVYVCVCMCGLMCEYICEYAWMRVYVQMYVCICEYIIAYMRERTDTHMLEHDNIYACVCVCVYDVCIVYGVCICCVWCVSVHALSIILTHMRMHMHVCDDVQSYVRVTGQSVSARGVRDNGEYTRRCM